MAYISLHLLCFFLFGEREEGILLSNTFTTLRVIVPFHLRFFNFQHVLSSDKENEFNTTNQIEDAAYDWQEKVLMR